MKVQTEELLYFLLWTADVAMAPTWRNLNDSFEQWAWRKGLSRRLAELQRQKLIERHPEPNLDRVVRLTKEGRRMALGGRDPTAQWSRPWDGSWRFILFDVPLTRGSLRQRFRRTLRQKHFGCLQGSVWISPDPAGGLRSLFGNAAVQTDALLVIEGRPVAGESDADIVNGAWDFALIRRRYEQHHKFLQRPPGRGAKLREWARAEATLWRNAIRLDPLLPQALLPDGYAGMAALQRRREVFARLARTAVSD